MLNTKPKKKVIEASFVHYVMFTAIIILSYIVSIINPLPYNLDF